MIAEFKLSLDIPAGGKWEDAPIRETRNIDENLYWKPGEFVDGIAEVMAVTHDCEVRWNWSGLNQGHYVGTGAA